MKDKRTQFQTKKMKLVQKAENELVSQRDTLIPEGEKPNETS